MHRMLCLFLLLLPTITFARNLPVESEIQALVESENFAALKEFGVAALEPLVNLYKKGDIAQKTKIASALYFLSLRSEYAREVLLKDVHTPDRQLRLQVQWALGRVSSDESVVHSLLDNMQHDPNPLFRDKAACALAHDQVHLTEKQRVVLLEGLINALGDEKPDVRFIAAKALEIQTNQTKGFDPNAPQEERMKHVAEWQAWVAEYRRNIFGE